MLTSPIGALCQVEFNCRLYISLRVSLEFTCLHYSMCRSCQSKLQIERFFCACQSSQGGKGDRKFKGYSASLVNRFLRKPLFKNQAYLIRWLPGQWLGHDHDMLYYTWVSRCFSIAWADVGGWIVDVRDEKKDMCLPPATSGHWLIYFLRTHSPVLLLVGKSQEMKWQRWIFQNSQWEVDSKQYTERKRKKEEKKKKIHRMFIQICYMTKGNKRELEEDKFGCVQKTNFKWISVNFGPWVFSFSWTISDSTPAASAVHIHSYTSTPTI